MKPPWTLTGSAVLLLSKGGVVVLVHYQTSPVGPYDEWARAILTFRGPRVVEMLVTSENSRRAGIENWGFPKQVANLHWQQQNNRIEFRAREIYRLRVSRFGFPLRVRFFCAQNLNGQSVRVPMKIKGRARLAGRGRQRALFVENFVFEVSEPEIDNE